MNGMGRLDRRRFLQGVGAMLPLFGVEGLPQAAGVGGGVGSTLLVGTQTGGTSRGIYRFAWDAGTGGLKPLGLLAASEMPTFLVLSRDGKLLFAANETDRFAGAAGGGVSSFRVVGGGSGSHAGGAAAHAEPGPGLHAEAVGGLRLLPVNTQGAGGAGTCHVGLHPTGRVLLCANYSGGSVSSFPVSAEGRIGAMASHFQYTGPGPDGERERNRERQEAPHAHRATVSPGGRWALFNDLGLDCIHVYALDAGTAKLTGHGQWTAPAGSGPRALAFHPNGRWAYCVTELNSEVMLLLWDEERGELTTRQRVSLLPAGFTERSQACEVVLDRAGRFAYAADRYYDGVYRFTVDAKTGELGGMERSTMAGRTPRHMALDPTERWLLTANQDSDTIEIWPRDPMTGLLGKRSVSVGLEKPQCLVFV